MQRPHRPRHTHSIFWFASVLLWLLSLPGVVRGAPGALDPSFASSNTVNSAISSMAIQPDGRILIAGSFSAVLGHPKLYIARLNEDGTLDESFDAGLAGPVNFVGLQSDGRILVSGGFLSFNGTQRNSMVRLQPNGQVDPSFALPWSPTPYGIRRFAVRGDGRIYIVGQFTSLDGHATPSVALVKADGSVDTSFTCSVLFGAVSSIALAPDPGNGPDLYVGGVAFTFPPSANRPLIGKLDALSGAFLPSFEVSMNPIPVSGAAIQLWPLSTGQLLVAGVQGGSNLPDPLNGMIRFNATGGVDPGFNAGPVPGLFEPNTAALPFQSFVRLPSGKIVAGGNFNTVQGQPRPNIVQLLANGSVDSGFNPGSGPNNSVNLTALQSDGKILIAGNFQQVDGVSRPFLARLHGDGSPPLVLDQPKPQTVWEGETASFAVRTAGDPNPSVTWLRDGTVVGIGSKLTLTNVSPSDAGDYIARLENSYATVDSQPAKLLVQSSAPVILKQPLPAALAVGGIALFNVEATGSRPLKFQWHANGQPLNGATNSLLGVPVNNKAAYTNVYKAVVSNPKGSTVTDEVGLSPSLEGGMDAEFSYLAQFAKTSLPFSENFHLNLRAVKAIARQPDGHIIVGGGLMTLPTKADTVMMGPGFNPNVSFAAYGITQASNHLFRLDAAGELALGDLATKFLDGPVVDVATAPDGAFYAVGSFTKLGNLPRQGVIRFHADGTVDTGFAITVQPSTASLVGVCVDSQNRVIVAGGFTQVNGAPRRLVARILPNGILDTAFVPAIDALASGALSDVAVQSDGKVLLAGSGFFVETLPGGHQIPQLVRLNADGSWDTEFDTAGGATGNGSDFIVRRVVVQPDQRLLISGNFTRFGGLGRTNLARLLPNGTADPDFSTANECCDAPGNDVRGMAVAPDGKIYIGGSFQTPKAAVTRMARLHSNGSWDSSWIPASGQLGRIEHQGATEAVLVQPDGKPIFGGNFLPQFYPVASIVDGAGFPPWVEAKLYYVAELNPADLYMWYGDARHAVDGLVRFVGADAVPGTLVILQQPIGGVVSLGASNFVMSVAATVPGAAAKYTYQWMKGGIVLSGETNSYLNLKPLSLLHSGSYSVLVTADDGYGPDQNVLSQTAKLKVLPSGSLLGQAGLIGGKFQWKIPPLNGQQFSNETLDGLVVLASSDLDTWEPLPNALQLIDGSLVISDTLSNTLPRRFYKLAFVNP